MHKHQLSMRKAHGKSGTFFESFGENFNFRDMHKKTDALLKFRHTQYAPFGASNCLKNKEFIL